VSNSPKDPTEIQPDEFHPAARSAYRWLKGFMVTNSEDYSRYKLALQIAAESDNRQAQICMGTIERLRTSQPVSDRYLLGLCWTILHLHNHEAIEAIAEKRVDPAYGPHESEFKLEEPHENS
jgi:hypothetical protein